MTPALVDNEHRGDTLDNAAWAYVWEERAGTQLTCGSRSDGPLSRDSLAGPRGTTGHATDWRAVVF